MEIIYDVIVQDSEITQTHSSSARTARPRFRFPPPPQRFRDPGQSGTIQDLKGQVLCLRQPTSPTQSKTSIGKPVFPMLLFMT